MAVLPWPFSRIIPTESILTPTAPATPVPGTRTSPSSLSALLRHFEKPGVTPPSSRVDPSLRQQEYHSLTLWNVYRLGLLAAVKGARFGLPSTILCRETPGEGRDF